MRKLILIILSVVFTQSVFAQQILKSIENKKTGESVTAFCDEYESNECQQVSIKYLDPRHNIEKTLFQVDPKQIETSSVKLQEIIHQMESDQMMKNKYKVLAAYRKVCEMGKGNKTNRVKFTDMSGCILKTAFAGTFFFGVGFMATGPGFALVAASKSLVAGGAVSSVALKDWSIVQFILFYPALGLDVARLATVYPVKTIVNKIQSRNLKRKIIPLLEEMSHEIENPEDLNSIENETMYEQDGYRHSVIKHKHFKKILKHFMPEEEIK